MNKRQEPVFEQNHAVYDCVEWSSKFGFGEYSKIENLEATSHYVSKYVSKEMFQLAPNKNRYLRSKGLKKPQVEYEHVDLSEGDVIESEPELVIHDWDKHAEKVLKK
ncbi:hypothetical protein AAFF39_03315 [Lactococcus garvieae]